MKIRSSLVLVLLGSTTAVTAFVAFLLLTLRLPEIEAEQKQRALESAQASAISVDHALAAFEAPLKTIVAGVRTGSIPRQGILDALLAGAPNYLAAYIVDRNGKVTAFARSTATGTDGDYAYLNVRALPTPSGDRDFVWSDRLLSIVTGNLVIAVITRIGDDHLVAEIAPEQIHRALAESTRAVSLDLLVVDGRGEWVSSNSALFGERMSNFAANPVIRPMLGGSTLTVAAFEDRGRYAFAGASSSRLDWRYITAVPAGTTNPIYRRTIVVVLVAFALSALLALALGRYAAGRIARPLLRLTERSRQVADGVPTNAWPHSGVDEVDTLSRNLERMSDALAQREAALLQANETLETRVAQRTSDLSRSNAELSDAIATLTRTQRELVRAEKLAALGSMVAGIAHELNTPIGNALLSSSTVQQRVAGFAKQAQNTLTRSQLQALLDDLDEAEAITQRNLQRAAELIQSFKQVAADRTSDRQRRFELAGLINETLVSLRPSFKLRPIEVINAIVPPVEMDSIPGAITQVVSNLVGNALMHAYGEGDAGRILIRAGVLDDKIQLSVEDDGRGMSNEILPRIFDPFFTTRMGTGGTGLGLSIVHGLVENVLDGTISVESAPGYGTRFVILCARVLPRPAAGNAAHGEERDGDNFAAR